MGLILDYPVYRKFLDIDGKPYIMFDGRPMVRLCATFDDEEDAKDYVARKKRKDKGRYDYYYIRNPEKKGPSAATENAEKAHEKTNTINMQDVEND